MMAFKAPPQPDIHPLVKSLSDVHDSAWARITNGLLVHKLPPATTQQCSSTSGVHKALSAMAKSCARGYTGFAQKYGRALINSDKTELALNHLARETLLDLYYGTEGSTNLAVDVALLAQPDNLDYHGLSPAFALSYMIELVSSPWVPRDNVNRNLHRALAFEQEITTEAMDIGAYVTFKAQLVKLMYETKMGDTTDPYNRYREQLFINALRRCVCGAVNPADDETYPGGDTPANFFLGTGKWTAEQSVLLHYSHKFNYSPTEFKHYGQKGVGIEDFQDFFESKDVKVLAGVPEYTYDSSTVEGRMVSVALSKHPAVVKACAKHPKMGQIQRRKVIDYMIDHMETALAYKSVTSLARSDFAAIQRQRFFHTVGMVASQLNWTNEHSAERMEIQLQADKLANELKNLIMIHLEEYRERAVNKILKL
jgi:hypothetical protein